MVREVLVLKKKNQIIVPAVCLLFISVACFSAFKVYSIQHGYHQARETYDAISSEYVIVEEITSTSDPEAQASLVGDSMEKKRKALEPSPLKVNFSELLRDTNPEIVAWIWCPDTVINYPVAQHADNIFYLNADIRGDPSSIGAIFLEYANFKDFSDRNNIMHGHHMNDGSMFATLSEWQQADYCTEHPVLYLNTVYGGNYKIEVLAAFTTTANSEAYRFEFDGNNDFMRWVSWLDSQSLIHPELRLSSSDRFITLSTCAYSSEDSRTVLVGRMVQMA